MKENKNYMDECMLKLMPVVIKYLNKKSRKFFIDEIEIVNFELSFILNLLGNIVMRHAYYQSPLMETLSMQTLENLARWFEHFIEREKRKKETH